MSSEAEIPRKVPSSRNQRAFLCRERGHHFNPAFLTQPCKKPLSWRFQGGKTFYLWDSFPKMLSKLHLCKIITRCCFFFISLCGFSVIRACFDCYYSNSAISERMRYKPWTGIHYKSCCFFRKWINVPLTRTFKSTEVETLTPNMTLR